MSGLLLHRLTDQKHTEAVLLYRHERSVLLYLRRRESTLLAYKSQIMDHMLHVLAYERLG
jgi:hypothetical protein